MRGRNLKLLHRACTSKAVRSIPSQEGYFRRFQERRCDGDSDLSLSKLQRMILKNEQRFRTCYLNIPLLKQGSVVRLRKISKRKQITNFQKPLKLVNNKNKPKSHLHHSDN